MKVLHTVIVLSLLKWASCTECKDIPYNCAIYKHLCEERPQMMETLCAKTCGFCPEGYTSHAGDEGGNSKESAIAGDDAEEDARYTGNHNIRAYARDESGNSTGGAYAGDDAEDDARDTKERIIGVYAGDEGRNSKESAIAGDDGVDEAAADAGVGIAGGSGVLANSRTGRISMDEALDNTDFCVSAKGTKVGGQCLVFSNEKKDWKDSVESCESKGQQLVKLTDPTAFNNFMKKNYAGRNFWLGGSDIEKEGHFVWLDGSPLVCFPWDNNQPDNKVGGKQHCLAWGWKNSFADDVCNRKSRYICEIQDPCVSAKGRKIGGQCLFFEKEHKDWKDSIESCESKGQKLVKLTDPTGFNSFMKKIYAGQHFWLGGSDIEKEGHFMWLDGSPLVNFPWDNNQPDNAWDGKEHCLTWGYKNSFNDNICNNKYRYICELEGYTSHAGDEGGNSKESAIARDDAEEDARHTGDHNTRAYARDESGNNTGGAYEGDDAEDDARDTKERIIGVYAGDEGRNSKESAIAGDDAEEDAYEKMTMFPYYENVPEFY